MDWLRKLKELTKKNGTTTVTCASVKSDGSPKIHQLNFRDFCQDQPIMLFTGSIRQPEIISLLKSKGTHDLLFSFPQDTFTVSGRMYLVCSPNHAHRLGTPSRRLLPVNNPEEYWEEERYKHWKGISKTYRASFTWPVSGETIKPPESASWSAYKDHNLVKRSYGMDVGYKYMTLDALPLKTIPSVTEPTEYENVHEMAYDNFCLFVFKIERVEYFQNQKVPLKTIFEAKNTWSPHEVTP